jgi:hypothetical protein
MREGSDGRFQPPRRGLLLAGVWAVAIGWSTYLVAVEADGDGGIFGVAVKVMGSIGILYALFLVTRPRQRDEIPGGIFKGGVVPAAGDDDGEINRMQQSPSAAQWAIITITLALAIGGLFYRFSQGSELHQSAAFFIGIPTILAITLAMTPRAKSATGIIVKGITLALLLSGIVFYEGFICILMAAPLFYLVGIVIGVPIDRVRKRRKSEGRVYSIIGLGLLLLSAEGVTPATSFSQRERVEVVKTIDASVDEVTAALASTPEFEVDLPFYLKLGFPRPVAAHGSGLEVGDTRTIVFGTESPMEPMGGDHHHLVSGEGGGTLELVIVRSRPGRVVFKAVHDRTAFTHWIGWGRSIVEWHAIDENTTEVSWTMSFRRKLSPAWYFGPWQRYAAKRAAGYLIGTAATP